MTVKDTVFCYLTTCILVATYPPKRRQTSTKLRGVTSRETVFVIVFSEVGTEWSAPLFHILEVPP
jgi:hypothetical protein